MPITPLPSPPEPTDSTSQFNTKAFSWVAALDTFTTQANALETNVDNLEALASTSATNAANSASAALTSANNAASSASAALTSANNAASSASSALTSANNAAASYDAFDDRYLGSKASNPTLDNDGNALITGALYFNTVVNEMRVWNGSSWQTASIAGGTVTSLNVTGSTILGDDSADTVTLNGTVQPGVVISGSSSSDALRITQTGSGNALVVEDSTNPDATPFVVDGGGTVIVRNATSTSTNVAGTPVTPILQSFDNGSGGLGLFRYAASTSPAAAYFAKSRSATNGTIGTIVQSGDSLLRISAAGDDGTQFTEAGRISIEVDGTPGTNDMPGRIVIATTPDGGSSPVERVRIDSAGNVGVGGTAAAGRSFALSTNITGSTVSRGYTAIGSIRSDVTNTASYFATSASTQDAAFTLTNLAHFQANQGTISGGSRLGVTNQFGYEAPNTLTGATNNYGFYSNIPSGTGRWNFYAAGSAANYFAGNVFVGRTNASGADNVAGSYLTPIGQLISQVNANSCLFLNRFTSDGAIVTFRRQGIDVGSISVTTTATAYNTSSDIRLKENIIDAPSASSLIDGIQVRSFDWKSGGHQRFGMVAQELEAVAPEAVTKGNTDDEMWSVDYSKLVPMLVKEIQNLRSRVQQLEGI